jgi:hypothetical protein
LEQPIRAGDNAGVVVGMQVLYWWVCRYCIGGYADSFLVGMQIVYWWVCR